MLTNVSFTRDEWCHLLRLLNIMNLSMFSWCQVLSNRKHSVMSKRVQESTLKEGRQWRSRDLWIWLQITSGVWRNIPRKSWVTRTETRIGSELCFIQRQENDAKHQPKPNNVFSREATRWHSIFQPQETGARWGHQNRKVKDGTPQDANLRPSIPRDGLQELAEKLNFVEEAPAFGIEALMTNVLIWGLFLSTTPSFILDQITLKIWKYTWTFRRTSTFFPQYSEVTIASSSGDSECENDWMDSSFMCEIYTFSWSSGRKQEYVSTQIPSYAWGMSDHAEANRRCENQIEEFRQSNSNRPIEFDWNISQDLRHWRSSRKSRKTSKIKTLNLKNLEIESSSRQCSMTSNGQRKEIQKNVFQTPNTSRITRRDSREDIGHSFNLVMKRNGMELTVILLQENGISLPHIVKRFEESGHPAFKSISAVIRGILKRKNNRDTIHFTAAEQFTQQIGSVSSEHTQAGVNSSVWGRISERWPQKGSWKRKWAATEECETAWSTFFGANSKE